MIVLPLLPFYATRLHASPRDRRSADRVVLHRPAAVGTGLGAGVGPVRAAAGAADRAQRLGRGVTRCSAWPTRCGCSSPRASCRARAAAPPAWPRPTWPTRSSPRTGHGRWAGSPRPPRRASSSDRRSASFAFALGPAAPGLVAAALCLVNVFFAWKWLPESRAGRRHDGASPRRPIWHPAWLVLRHPTNLVSRLIWIYGIGMIAFSAMTSVLSLYLQAEFGLDGEDHRADLRLRRRALAGDAKRAAGADRGPPGGELDHANRCAGSRGRTSAVSYSPEPLDPGGRHPPRTDRHGAPVPGDDLAHVALFGRARAGNDHGRGPDLRRAGPGGRAAAGDDDLPAARATTGRSTSRAPSWRSPAHSRCRFRESPECPRSLRRRRKQYEHPRVSTDDRLDRLEQRLAVLETLVRQLAASGIRRQAAAPPSAPMQVAAVSPAPQLPEQSAPDERGHRVPPEPIGGTSAGPPPPAPLSAIPPASHRGPAPSTVRPAAPQPGRSPGDPPALDSEQWIGQRVFLGIGVVALLMAAGYLLKLSFERGWISPVMRCARRRARRSRGRRARLAARTAIPHLRRGAGRAPAPGSST